MDKSIKTRSVVKDIKTLNKRAGATHSIKTISTKTRNIAESVTASKVPRDRDGRAYAEEKVETGMHKGASRSAYSATNQIKGVANRTSQARKLTKDAAQTTARRTARHASDSAAHASRKAGKTGTKAVTKSIKTIGRSARTTVKTAKHTPTVAKSATAASKAVARNAGFAARSAAHTATFSAKATGRAITAFVKMAIASAKSLAAALAAVGGTAVAAIVIICLVAIIAVSAFGIFFTGGDLGDGNPSLREVVSEINEEHTSRINQIKASNAHDEISLNGTKTPWKEVLAIYAVKVTTDRDTPLDVVTLDAKRQQILKVIFWEMNSIESRVEEREFTEIVLETDEHGNQVETSKSSTKKVLYITLVNKSSEEMAAAYGFNVEQLDLLHQLLDKQYDSTWQSVLYGISRGSGDIVEVATEQLGNIGGQPYWSWYGFNGRVEWCACFVSWCANECGYIEAGVIPKFSYCPTGVQWFKDAELWQERGYSPQPGDIIFFDWGNDGTSDHVGIVESCDGSTVRTIEGNTSDSCARRAYPINSVSIMGYGTPLYQ